MLLRHIYKNNFNLYICLYLDVLKYVKTGSEVVIVLRVNAAAVNAHVLLLIENVTQMFVEIVGLGMSKPHLSYLLVCVA